MRQSRTYDRKDRSSWQKILRLLCSLGILLGLTVIVCDGIVEYSTEGYTSADISKVPSLKVGLILGTSKYSSQGQNLFYQARIDAAVALFESGKVQYLLISGDNGTKYYNEPKAFREDLIARGIPDSRIVLDYAGFRTLDSVIRAKKVFQLETFIVISQEFHNERAIFIAQRKGMNVIGYNAKDVKGQRGMKTKVRERLARVKLMLDLLLNTEAKFLGDPIPIGE